MGSSQAAGAHHVAERFVSRRPKSNSDADSTSLVPSDHPVTLAGDALGRSPHPSPFAGFSPTRRTV
jgi:hypothetical protein